MRYLPMYFSSRVVEGITTFIYTTRKSFKCTLNVGSTTDTFNLSYWDGKPKGTSSVASSGSYTMWLTKWSEAEQKSLPLPREEAYLYKEVYGDECVLAIDAAGQGSLIPMSQFNELPSDEKNIVTPEQLNA